MMKALRIFGIMSWAWYTIWFVINQWPLIGTSIKVEAYFLAAFAQVIVTFNEMRAFLVDEYGA